MTQLKSVLVLLTITGPGNEVCQFHVLLKIKVRKVRIAPKAIKCNLLPFIEIFDGKRTIALQKTMLYKLKLLRF